MGVLDVSDFIRFVRFISLSPYVCLKVLTFVKVSTEKKNKYPLTCFIFSFP